MHAEYPYMYIQKVNDTEFAMSIFLEPPRIYIVENFLTEERNYTRRIRFTEGDIPGEEIAPSYRIPTLGGQQVKIESIVFPLYGKFPWNKNTSTLLTIDIEKTPSPIQSKRYLPHLYLIKIGEKAVPYQLFIAIENATDSQYKIVSNFSPPLGAVRTIIIKEIDASGQEEGIWSYDTPFFDDETAEFITVIVQGKDGQEKGKGTVRHSAADIKPFDLDDL